MEIKVGQVKQSTPVEQTQSTQPTDGSFKFMLASHIEESELQTRLQGLMEEITMQGDRLAKRRDVKDMKHHRSLVKAFMNEVVTLSHAFSSHLFPRTSKKPYPIMALAHWLNRPIPQASK